MRLFLPFVSVLDARLFELISLSLAFAFLSLVFLLFTNLFDHSFFFSRWIDFSKLDFGLSWVGGEEEMEERESDVR